MRKYAAFYNSNTKMWSVLFQDENDYESDVWYVHLENLCPENDKSTIMYVVRALNESSLRDHLSQWG